MKTIFSFNHEPDFSSDPVLASRHQELLDVMELLPVPVYEGKSDAQADLDLVHPVLNALADCWLKQLGWQTQSLLNALTEGDVKGKDSLDFSFQLPDGRYIGVEVQFGNQGRLRADFTKLRKLHKRGLLAMGYCVYFDRATAKTADSGLADYEKALRHLDELEGMPMCLVGVSREGTREVDLKVVRGVPFPSAFGGKGIGVKEVHAFVAEAIVNEQDLSTVVLPENIQLIVRNQARGHMLHWLRGLSKVLNQAADCSDTALREELLALAAEAARNSYREVPAAKHSCATSRKSRVKRSAASRCADSAPAVASSTRMIPLGELAGPRACDSSAAVVASPSVALSQPAEGKPYRVAAGTLAPGMRAPSSNPLRPRNLATFSPQSALGASLARALAQG